MTDGTLTAVLQMECFSVQNLIEIAKELSINTYRAVPTSFRLSYKELGYAIQKELNVSFGMVEGMHRIYTVKNVLEGRYLPDCTEEPSLQNKFLGRKTRNFKWRVIGAPLVVNFDRVVQFALVCA